MIVFPHSKNHQTARSLAVSFYKTDNIKNSKKTEQNKDAETVDKEIINKKKSVKSEEVHKEPKVKKRFEKKVDKKRPLKTEDNKKRTESNQDKVLDRAENPQNSNEGFREAAAERSLSKLPYNPEKLKISERSSFKMLKNNWNEEEDKKYLEYIRKKITNRIKYPSIARRRGIEGEVFVSFNIRKDGTIKNVELAKKSSYSVLNDAVLKAMNNIVITKTPEESIAVTIPINFTLK